MLRYLRNHQIRIPLYNSTSKCIYCNATLIYNRNTNQYNAKHVPYSLIPKLYLNNSLLLHTNNLYCEDIHDIDAIHLIPTQPLNNNASSSSYHRSLLLINHHISKHYKPNADDPIPTDPPIQFATSSPKRIKSLSRLTPDQIQQLSLLCNVAPDILFLFYTICNKNWSYSTVESTFGFPKCTTSRYFHKALDALHDKLVPDDVIGTEHEPCIFVIDGVPIYVQKSSHHNYKHRSYCVHKKRQTLQMMPIECANGVFVGNVGPCYSDESNSDSNIFRAMTDIGYVYKCIDDPDDPHNPSCFNRRTLCWLQYFNTVLYTACDKMIADRGFHDFYVKHNDHRVLTPKKNKQLTTKQANNTRKVTFARWVIECTYNRLKEWSILRERVDHQRNPIIGELVEVLQATLNEFFRPLTEDTDLRNEYVDRILRHQDDVEPKYKPWSTVNRLWIPRVSHPFHPNDTIQFIRNRLQVPHFRKRIQIQEHEQHPKVYRFVHVLSSYKDSDGTHPGYRVVVDFNKHHPQPVDQTIGHRLDYMERQSNWYCLCPSGARTVNPCAHVIAVLMFIYLVRSDRLNHPLSQQPSEPINCALYEQYAKQCPNSWRRQQSEAQAPSSCDNPIDIGVTFADDTDESSDNEYHEAEEKWPVTRDDDHLLVRNNSNNTNHSAKSTIDTDEDDYYPSDVNSDDDIINEMDAKPWASCNNNNNTPISPNYSKREMDDEASDVSDAPPPKKRRYNTRSGRN